MMWRRDQLHKYRIRKADPDEQPPWVKQRFDRDASRFHGAAVHPLPPADRWWVYEPGSVEVSACWPTHAAAVEHVRGLICHRVVGAHMRRVEQ
ncbi:hypothetical protein SEA_TYPHA_82 [Mycobacterium phage Typha]|uniref:Uncharacterized protein n=1 Tax=Mycobacterium phage Typha TaxID=2517971 RepID=A0A482J6V0_9CAUD|nr:hypothetical protein KCH40_gp087 [Mycobacterium phage Typha]QBP29737.1 hypothetical protein SEA_TYPHA_82 [Mycobacterium phage Typha]URM86524.1 hypothetical protein PBI_HILLTOPFARM_83 [Mycobacterium phage Hilltopfarm]